jgi:hypothetical protein
MTPTRRDFIRRTLGSAAAFALPAGVVAAALPATANAEPFSTAPGVDVIDVEPNASDFDADFFVIQMRRLCANYPELNATVKVEHDLVTIHTDHGGFSIDGKNGWVIGKVYRGGISQDMAVMVACGLTMAMRRL